VLTVADCRELLGLDAPEKDEDVETLRDLVAVLVRATFDSLPPAEEEK
jgi:hypothetical protein